MAQKMLVFVAWAAAISGCGAGGEASTSSRSQSQEANEAVIQAAAESPEVAAERGAPAVRRTLQQRLQMAPDESFRLHPGQPTKCEQELIDNGEADTVECVGDESDCYVKTGAEAFAFAETDPANILRSPNGRDLVFVQTYVGVPLSKCLVAVQRALNW